MDASTVVDIVTATDTLIEPLDAYIQSDPVINWPDIIPYIREVSCTYNDSIVGVPVAGNAATMYYRKDILAAANLPIPNTWCASR